VTRVNAAPGKDGASGGQLDGGPIRDDYVNSGFRGAQGMFATLGADVLSRIASIH